jgi:hypothetical protein
MIKFIATRISSIRCIVNFINKFISSFKMRFKKLNVAFTFSISLELLFGKVSSRYSCHFEEQEVKVCLWTEKKEDNNGNERGGGVILFVVQWLWFLYDEK